MGALLTVRLYKGPHSMYHFDTSLCVNQEQFDQQCAAGAAYGLPALAVALGASVYRKYTVLYHANMEC